MKRIFTLTLILSIATLSIFASSLNITLKGNQQFIIRIDCDDYYSNYGSVFINNINPGYHKLEIIEKIWNKHNQDFEKTIYNGFFTMKNNTQVLAEVSPYGFKIVSEIPMRSELCIYDRKHHGNNQHKNNVGFNGYYGNDIPKYGAAGFNRMSHRDFNELKASIKYATFESTKLDIALNAVKREMISTYDLVELMDLLTFESSKLSLAKAAYPNLLDPDKVYIIYRAFTFDSSIREFQRFVGNRF